MVQGQAFGMLSFPQQRNHKKYEKREKNYVLSYVLGLRTDGRRTAKMFFLFFVRTGRRTPRKTSNSLLKRLPSLYGNLQFGAVQRYVNLVDVEKCWKMNTQVLIHKFRLRYSRARAPTISLYDQGSRALIWDRFCPRCNCAGSLRTARALMLRARRPRLASLNSRTV